MYLLELHHCKKKISPFEPPRFSTGVGHPCSLITEDEEQKFPCRLDFAGRNFCNSLTRNFTQKMSIVFPCCPLRLTHSILLWFVHGDVMQRREIQVSSSLHPLSPFSFNLSKLQTSKSSCALPCTQASTQLSVNGKDTLPLSEMPQT